MLPIHYNSKTSPRFLPPFTSVTLENVRMMRTPRAISLRGGYRTIVPSQGDAFNVLKGTYYELNNGRGYLVAHFGDGDGDNDGTVEFNQIRTTSNTLEFTNNWNDSVGSFSDGGTSLLENRGSFTQRNDNLYFSDGVKTQGWTDASTTTTMGLTPFPGVLYTGNVSDKGDSVDVRGKIPTAKFSYLVTKYNESRNVESLPQGDHHTVTGAGDGISSIVTFDYQFQPASRGASVILFFKRKGLYDTDSYYSLNGTTSEPTLSSGETLRIYRVLIQTFMGEVVGSIFNARLVAEVDSLNDFIDTVAEKELGERLTFAGSAPPDFSQSTIWGDVWVYSGTSNPGRIYLSMPDSPENVPVDVEWGRDVVSGTDGVRVSSSEIKIPGENLYTHHVMRGDYIHILGGTNVASPGVFRIKELDTTDNTGDTVVIDTDTPLDGGSETDIEYEIIVTTKNTLRPQVTENFFAEQFIPFKRDVTGILGTASGLLVGTKQGTFLVRGTNPTNWHYSILSTFDCVSPESMCWSPYGVVWVSSVGLIFWDFNSAPRNITDTTFNFRDFINSEELKKSIVCYVESESSFACFIPDSNYNQILWFNPALSNNDGVCLHTDDLSDALASGEEITTIFVASPSNYPDFLVVGTSIGRFLAEFNSVDGKTDDFRDNDGTTNTIVNLSLAFWTGQDTFNHVKSNVKARIHSNGANNLTLTLGCGGTQSDKIPSTSTQDINITETRFGERAFHGVNGNLLYWTITRKTASNDELVLTDIEIEESGHQDAINGRRR